MDPKKIAQHIGDHKRHMDSLLTRAIDEGRDLTEAEQKDYNEREAKIEELNKLAERVEKRSQMPETQSVKLDVRGFQPSASSGETRMSDEDAEEKRYNDAFNVYLRAGRNDDVLETRALSTSGMGGIVAARGFADRWKVSLSSYAGVLAAGCDVVETADGEAFTFPTANDLGNSAEIVAENASRSVADSNHGVVVLGAYIYSSKQIVVPNTLLADHAADLEGRIIRTALQDRIGRTSNSDFTLADGSSKPSGFLYPYFRSTTPLTGISTKKDDEVSLSDILALMYSVDPAYHDGAAFQMSKETYAHLLTQEGSGPGNLHRTAFAGGPNTLFGYKVVFNPAMPAYDAAASGNWTSVRPAVAFGNWQAAYVVRRVASPVILRSSEVYWDKQQTAFMVEQRLDGKITDAAAYNVLDVTRAE